MASPNICDNQKKYFEAAKDKFGDAFTGFNELSVSSAYPIIDLKSIYGVTNLRDRVVATGSGAVTNADGLFAVSTGTTTGSVVSLSSSEFGRYVAGFEATPGLGGFLNRDPEGDEVARWGYFTDDEGFGFGRDSEGLFVFVRRKGVERKAYKEQDEWLYQVDFETTDFHIYRMPFRWYGEGPVKYEVSIRDDNELPGLELVHAFAALTGENITTQPNLPVRVEVDNGTGTGDLIFYVGGRQFFLQGNYNPDPRPTSEAVSGFSVSDGVFVPVISFQQKSAFSDVSAKLQSVSVYATSADVHWKVLIGGVTSGGAGFTSISDIPDTETAFEVKTDATGITGGQKLSEDFAIAGQGRSAGGSFFDLTNVDLPKDQEITLVAAGDGGTATVKAVLTLREEW